MDSSIQDILPKVRTDFDAFSRLLISNLVRHGYEVGKKSITQFAASHTDQPRVVVAEAASHVWEPFDSPVGLGSKSAEVDAISRDRFSRRKLFSARDPWGSLCLLCFAVIVLSVAYFTVTGMLAAVAAGYKAWRAVTVGQVRSIDVDVELVRKATLLKPSPTVNPGEAELAHNNEIKLWRTIYTDLERQFPDASTVVYFVHQSHPFANSIAEEVSFKFGHQSSSIQPEILAGQVFLVDEAAARDSFSTPARHMTFRTDQEGRVIGNGVKLDKPRANESLWMIIAVKGENLPISGELLKQFTLTRD